MGSFGTFPFGRPNTVRPARRATAVQARAVVVGVYPSAWHISWRAPAYLGTAGRTGGVAALAVDVEPTVFWNGDTSEFETKLREWMDGTGFIEGDEPGEHGVVSLTSPSTNGSSGTKVEDKYLAPLSVTADETCFTDVYPVFVVKRGKGSRREQGDAIDAEYNAIASSIGRSPSSLPARPGQKALVAAALTMFRSGLIADLESADARRVITLGDEAMRVLSGIAELSPQPPADTLADLYGDRYGEPGTIRVNDRRVEWLALAHPGLLKGTPSDCDIDPRKRTIQGWNWLHAQWQSGPRR